MIDNEYNIGDIVYLRTDAEPMPRLVIGLIVSQNGILYQLAQGVEISTHYDFEMTVDKPVIFN